MSVLRILAAKEVRTAMRDRLFLLLAGLFLGLSVLSVYVGTSTKRAEMALFHQRQLEIQQQGLTTVLNAPEIHPLNNLSNFVDYATVMGGVLAILLGFGAFEKEERSGGLKLILSRPVFRDQFLTAKWLGNAMVLGLVMLPAFLVSGILMGFVDQAAPTLSEWARLATLFLVAFVYLVGFLSVSLSIGLHSKTAVNGFLFSLLYWLAVAFVIPQWADTQMTNNVVASLVNGTPNALPQENQLSAFLHGLSPAWHFQNIGSELLETAAGSAQLPPSTWILDSLSAVGILLVPIFVGLTPAYVRFTKS